MRPFHRVGAAGGLGEGVSGEGACGIARIGKQQDRIAATANTNNRRSDRNPKWPVAEIGVRKPSVRTLVFLFHDHGSDRDTLLIIAQAPILREIQMLPDYG